jgi:aminopeptidase N
MIKRALVGLFAASMAALCFAPATLAADPPNSLGLDATYDVHANLHWSARRLVVSSTALVTNNTDEPVDALTFNLVPAAIGHMVLDGVTVGPDADNEAPADATVDGQSVIVNLAASLDPGGQTAVTIDYTASFGKRSRNKGYLLQKVRGIATAYRWVPWLSVDYPFATPTFGEPFVTGVSDEVDVTITTDRPLTIASTGHETSLSDDGLTHTFVAHNVRDFNFAASPKYQTQTEQWGDVTITWYYTTLSYNKIHKWTLRAVQHYADRVGPYGYKYLNVAEMGSFLGMESPGMVWISNHRPSLVKYLTVHELAHEWFYAVVGNDQATEPFADESLAEFLTRDLLGQTNSSCAQDDLDREVYGYSATCYYPTLYVQGADYIQNYRLAVGEDAFWTGLRQYYADYSFKIGGTQQLFTELDTASNNADSDHSDRFPSLFPGGQ